MRYDVAMQAVAAPDVFAARADARRPVDGPFGASTPERPDSARPAVEFGGALTQMASLTKNPVDPSSTAEKSRDKLKWRESAERRQSEHTPPRSGRLVDIRV
jgi:hypothetical protein